jgi:hypothetical protein
LLRGSGGQNILFEASDPIASRQLPEVDLKRFGGLIPVFFLTINHEYPALEAAKTTLSSEEAPRSKRLFAAPSGVSVDIWLRAELP